MIRRRGKKESKKSQHQIKVKEVKLKPNIDDHDFLTKSRQAKDFLSKGNKVKVTCTFRGRELVHFERGEALVRKFCEDLGDVSTPEAPLKQMGRFLHVILAPGVRKKKENSGKKEISESPDNNENQDQDPGTDENKKTD